MQVLRENPPAHPLPRQTAPIQGFRALHQLRDLARALASL